MKRISPFLPLMLSTLACAPQWKTAPYDTRFQRVVEQPVPRPAVRAPVSDWWEAGLEAGVRPIGKALSPATYFDWLWGGRAALDVNDFGEVPASSWYEPRIVRGQSPTEVTRASAGHGPKTDRLVVIAGKESGATPGFVVNDADGVTWYVKFDPPGFPQLATGAEMIASRVLHAAGYWVPETHLVEVDPQKLELAPDAVTRGKYNDEMALDRKRLTEFIALLNPRADGRVRAVFSRRVPGELLGPFEWRGLDEQDENDRIPHERRRSLRGLWVFFAWLNNTDAKSSNTLDAFLPEDGDLGRVRHYLQDFGDSIGAAGNRAKYIQEGYEPYFSWGESGRRLLALGMRYPYWLGRAPAESRAIGPFESQVFDPARWSPQFPNPAFEEATAWDTLWAAGVLARFGPDHIRAAVGAAQYDSALVTARVVQVLTERRRKLLEYAFDGFVALDNPRVEGRVLKLDDLMILGGVSCDERFQYEVSVDGAMRFAGTHSVPWFDLSQIGPLDGSFATVTIRRGAAGETRVHLRILENGFLPVALEHDRW